MTSESEHANPNTNHIEEFHRSPCENNPTTSSDQSDSDSNNDEQLRKNEFTQSSTRVKPGSNLETNLSSHKLKKTDTMKIDRISASRRGTRSRNRSNRVTLNKKLSYDDDEDEIDDDDDAKASSLSNGASPTCQTTFTRNNSTSVNELADHDNVEGKETDDSGITLAITQKNGLSNKDTDKNISSDIKLAESVDSDHDGVDASSTSSCSCEDHSSVNGETSRKVTQTSASNRHVEDEIHINDLDYNEDSMSDDSSNSPLEYNRLASERKITTTQNNSINQKDDDDKASRSTAYDSQNTTHKNHKHNKIKESNERSPSPNEKSQKKTTTRIKSFINKTLNIDDEDSNNQMEQDESSSGNECREKILSSLVASKSKKSIDFLLKYFFKDACYFQVKSINHDNVELSKSMGVWSTSMQNEIRFNTAFREHRNVILIFSVQQSGAFQGFARMVSESKQTSRPIPWILPPRMSNKSLSGVFKIEWLCTKELQFHETHELYNPFNENKPVKVARDGQQVVSKIGKKLCKLFPHNDDDDEYKSKLLNSIATLKYQTSQRKKSNHKQDNFYPLLGGRTATGNSNTGRIDDRFRIGRQQAPSYMQQHPIAAGLNGFISPGGYPDANHHSANQHEYMNSYNSYGGHMNFPGDQLANHYYSQASIRSRQIHNNPYYNRMGLYMPTHPPAAHSHKHSGNSDDNYYHHHHQPHPQNNPHQHNLPLAYDNPTGLSKSTGSDANHRYHPYRKNRR